MLRIEKWIKKQYHRLSKKQLIYFLVLLLLVIWVFFLLQKMNLLFTLVLTVPVLSALIIPSVGRSIYSLLMLLSFPFGFVLSTIILYVVYLFFITPLRLFKRKKNGAWYNSSTEIDAKLPYE